MSKIFSVEGNIGSGKSTLIRLLKEKNNDIICVYEPVDIWETIKDKQGESILEKFYKDQEKYAFSFQMMAYISRLDKLKQIIKQNPTSIIITERSVQTDKNVFANMLYNNNKIEEVNYAIYLKWFEAFIDEIPLQGVIYLQTEPVTCHQRVLKRSRTGETISLDYLKMCNQYHDNWLERKVNIFKLDGNKNFECDKTLFNKWNQNILNFVNEN